MNLVAVALLIMFVGFALCLFAEHIRAKYASELNAVEQSEQANFPAYDDGMLELSFKKLKYYRGIITTLPLTGLFLFMLGLVLLVLSFF